MDADRLDALARALAESGHRRTLLRVLARGALGLATWQRVELAQLGAAKKCNKIKDKQRRKRCKNKANRTNGGRTR